MVDIKRKPKGKAKQYAMYVLGAVALSAMTWFFMTLEAAPPTVEAAIIWTGHVERGELLRQAARVDGASLRVLLRSIMACTHQSCHRNECRRRVPKSAIAAPGNLRSRSVFAQTRVIARA